MTSELYKSFSGDLYRFIQKRVKDHETAQDLLQEVFIKIHLKIATLKNDASLVSWLYQVTRNTIIDHFNRRNLMSDLPADLFSENDLTSANEELEGCLSGFIAHLPPEYREALQLTALKGVSQKEFALLKGISYSGAKSRVQRARQELYARFIACCEISADRYGNVVEYAARNNCPGC